VSARPVPVSVHWFRVVGDADTVVLRYSLKEEPSHPQVISHLYTFTRANLATNTHTHITIYIYTYTHTYHNIYTQTNLHQPKDKHTHTHTSQYIPRSCRRATLEDPSSIPNVCMICTCYQTTLANTGELSVGHTSSVSASAVRYVKKGTQYRDLQYNPISVGIQLKGMDFAIRKTIHYTVIYQGVLLSLGKLHTYTQRSTMRKETENHIMSKNAIVHRTIQTKNSLDAKYLS